MEKKLVSIIIRSKNEEKWISLALKSILRQTIKNFEIILVDNNSSDNTVKIAKSFGLRKIFNIKNFFPGQALNRGCKNAVGKYLVFLSAHCIPSSKYWLERLVSKIDEKKSIIAAYGRQLPLKYSNANDVRDLLITFGNEDRIQSDDPLFHNANSCILRKFWKKFKFDNRVTNIEDRLWASKIIKKKYKIFYNHRASVYHYHGIHHSLDEDRSASTLKVLSKIDNFKKKKPFFLYSKERETHALFFLDNKNKFKNKYKKKIISLIKNPLIKKFHIFGSKGILKDKKIIFYKTNSLNKFSLDKKFKFAYKKISNRNKILPEFILYCNLTYEYLSIKIIKENLKKLVTNGYDTLIPVIEDYSINWMYDDNLNVYRPISKNYENRYLKKPLLKSLFGLGTITTFTNLKDGDLIKGNYHFSKIDSQKISLRY